MKATFLRAEWKNLIFANYRIDPDILKSYLPHKTEIDFFDGHTYVSLVGFQFYKTRILGMGIPFHTNFLEVNLRFYVRYKDANNWKRGTVFISEIVPRSAITFVANTIYHEQYRTMKMTHHLYEKEGMVYAGYQWQQQKNWNSIDIAAHAATVPINKDSLEEFITEHYWGYSKQQNKVTFEYEVAHPRWLIYPIQTYNIHVEFESLYGKSFAFLQDLTPSSVLFAEGSEISVFKKKKL